jgi:transcriptional regulator with GAF, ATPase, and Fis domain/pSer/pThr/pTyr-binding forkhead associated (FHA) protein
MTVRNAALLIIQLGQELEFQQALNPDERFTIGRSSSSDVVLHDDQCSRRHASIYYQMGVWRIEDLASRNGTSVNGLALHDSIPLNDGDAITIGRAKIEFHVHPAGFTGLQEYGDSQQVPDEKLESDDALLSDASDGSDDDVWLSDSSVDVWDEAEITRRRGETHYLPVTNQPLPGDRRASGERATRLCQLAFSLATSDSLREMAALSLDALIDMLNVEVGAVILGVDQKGAMKKISQWRVIATRRLQGSPYRGVSTQVAKVVSKSQDVVLFSWGTGAPLAADASVSSDTEPRREGQKTMICAPLRFEDRVLGMLHLYSTTHGVSYDTDDLEYALAVANSLAVAFDNATSRGALKDSLSKVQSANVHLREQLDSEFRLVGSGQAMGEVHRMIERAAMSKATVLVRGESGVGKELVARAVHSGGTRRDGPFVCLNCAALSEDLLASELFGHERGAFTGATDRKVGKFEAADQGSLFLDEIGEMSKGLQAKFLRVLEGHPFERVGGNESVKVDVRVIAATNRDLEREAAEGRFRRDLFFRLRVLEIVVPPLRRRKDDLLELAEYFLGRFRDETGRRIRGFSADAVKCLREYRWPGNVRELKNVIERAVLVASSDSVRTCDLLLSDLVTAGDTGILDGGQTKEAGYEPCSISDMERRHIVKTLEFTDWNKSRAAGILGIERSTLDRKLRRYGIEKKPRDSSGG